MQARANRELSGSSPARHDRRAKGHQQVVAQHADPLGDLVVRQRSQRGEDSGPVKRDLGHAQGPQPVQHDPHRAHGRGRGGDDTAGADE